MKIKWIAFAGLMIAVLVALPWMSLADPADQGESPASPVHLVLEPGASQTHLARDSASALAVGWETIKTENFEGTFPNDWDVRGDPTWDDEWDSDPAFAHDLAQWTGWCAGGGASARSPGALPGGAYAPDMNAWMIYGPFSLRGCSTASVNFWYWLWSETGTDWLLWSASTDGANFHGHGDAGSNKTWREMTFNLSDVPALGSLAGKRQVWIAFAFASNPTVAYKGAYLDDIEIKRYRSPPPVNVSVDPETGLAYTGVWYTFATTWSDLGGWGDLKQCYVHFGTSPTLANNVTLLYNAQSNKVWLRNDAGTAWLGGHTIGTTAAIENSQAYVATGTMSTLPSGDNLTVTWVIAFKPAFAGVKKVGMKALDRWGAKAKAEWMGTWGIFEP
jgi:hypothetical protein